MAGLQVNLYVCIGITWIAALITLVLRVFARRITRVDWWCDDYFSVLAFLFATGYCAILIPWAQHYYLGSYMPDDLDPNVRGYVLYMARKLGFFNSLCYASSLACSKLSILFFYWRLFKTSVIRIPIIVVIVISAIWWIIRTFMLTFRCVPTAAIWDKNIKDAVCNINGDQFFLGTITTHFLLDVIILVLPIIPVFNLRLRLQQKLGIVVFFLLGTIVCVASCIVLVILIHFPAVTNQLPYDYTTFCLWGVVEVNIAVVSGCLPLLRPVVRRAFPNMFPSAFSSQQPSRPSKAIKMSTMNKTEKNKEADDSSSTHQLAGSEIDDYGHNDGGVQTVISSELHGWATPRSEERMDLTSIRVRKETVVEVKAV